MENTSQKLDADERHTVESILKSGLLSSASVLAGTSGLDRRVDMITVFSVLEPSQWIRGGELILTNGFAFKERPEQLASFIRVFAQANCAALGIQMGRFLQDLPEQVLCEADKLRFPVISLPHHLAWSDIITGFHRTAGRASIQFRLDLLNICLVQHPTRPFSALRSLVDRISSHFGPAERLRKRLV